MSDDKPKPIDDLKEGFGLLFRAAKGAVESLPTDKIEGVTNKIEKVGKDAAKEVGRAFESLGSEVDKLIHQAKPNTQPPPQGAAPPAANAAPPATTATGEPAKEENFDDGYAPEPPPKGPRVG